MNVEKSGDRLRNERLRMGLNQDEMAAAGGVKKGTYWNYEKNERAPDAAALTAWAAAGVDVQYVLTGLRMPPTLLAQYQRAAQITIAAHVSEEDRARLLELHVQAVQGQAQVPVTAEESRLLAALAECSPEDRAAVYRVARGLAVAHTDEGSATRARQDR